MQYKRFGVMLDCSRNAVLKVSQVKKMIDELVKLGYNTLELYTEDTYEIEDEPYFGYMRGRYTGAEIREIDVYAQEKGVELIPCIQTLAHLEGIFKHPAYASVRDTANILLIDEEKTYALIEKMFQSIAQNFTSRLVNIGMDEAHMVGLGRYLDKHGYQNRFELLSRHLQKVLAIAEKYGFKPHMWSDMFFRLANGGNYYVGETFEMPQEVIDSVPNGVDLVYWDYYHTKKADYDCNLAAHKKIGKPTWFAGGAWSWDGFAPHNRFSMETMRPAMESVREHGVENVLITMWGDNGGECSFFSLLPALYAIRQYADGNFDEAKIAEQFEKIFEVPFYDFMALDLPNQALQPDDENFLYQHRNPCKSLLYSDPFMGIKDKAYEKQGEIDWADYAATLARVGKKTKKYGYLFKTMQALCKTLVYKAGLGLKIRKAYKAKDRALLREAASDCGKAVVKLAAFQKCFYELWVKENKAFGWEIQDARLGGLRSRLLTCQKRLNAYMLGSLGKIEELEAELLPTWEGDTVSLNNYALNISWNNL